MVMNDNEFIVTKFWSDVNQGGGAKPKSWVLLNPRSNVESRLQKIRKGPKI